MSTGKLAISAVTMALFAGCVEPGSSGPAPGLRAADGGCGDPSAYVTAGEGDAPEEIGIRFDGNFLTCVMTAGQEFEWVLDFGKAAELATPFQHVYLVWNPAGHAPPMIYDRPHFDAHFHTVSPDTRMAYCSEDGTDIVACMRPPPGQMPLPYVPGPSEPGHGVHWVSVSSPEFMGQGFTSTLIFGSYDGELVFVEPMISSEFLLGLPPGTTRFEVPSPNSVSYAGWYPGAYLLHYDERKADFAIALAEFEYRE